MSVDAGTRRKLIERYADSVRAVSEAAASLSLTDLDRHAGNAWSAREVIHHIADAELVEGLRLRRILAEVEPKLPWVDEEEYARRLHYERPVETSLEVAAGVVRANLTLLEALTDDEWRRIGWLDRKGRYSVEDWLREMAEHAQDHTAQMLRAAGHGVI